MHWGQISYMLATQWTKLIIFSFLLTTPSSCSSLKTCFFFFPRIHVKMLTAAECRRWNWSWHFHNFFSRLLHSNRNMKLLTFLQYWAVKALEVCEIWTLLLSRCCFSKRKQIKRLCPLQRIFLYQERMANNCKINFF